MTSSTSSSSVIGPVRACTVSRDVQLFDLLIEDMEALLGENWGDLGFTEAKMFLDQPEAAALDFIALAIDDTDEEQIDRLAELIAAATARGVKVVLIAEDVSPGSLHRLLRSGANEFVPYPLPEDELEAAIQRMRHVEAPAKAQDVHGGVRLDSNGDGVMIATHGLSGGVGATTFAVNLAWELASIDKDPARAPRVCLLDLGLQFGSVATYLDLPLREAVLQILTDVGSLDQESFGQALVKFNERLHVFTAPPDVLPLDLVGPEEVQKIIDIACEHFDFVVIDMPQTVVQWSETVLQAAQIFFAIVELDMRSAQNTLRMKRVLQAAELPFEKLRFVLNRAPKFTDLQGKSRARRMAESLDITLDIQMPDGGRTVTQACDHGLPLAIHCAKNPLRREIAKLAQSLHAVGQSDADAA